MNYLIRGFIFGLGLSATVAFAQSNPPIKIGNLVPLTGPAAGTGENTKAGVEVAFEEVMYQAGGRQLQLITEDSQFKGDVALSQTRKLVERDGVKVLLGPTGTHECVAIRSYIVEKGLVWIPTQCTGKELSPPKKTGPYVFRPSFQYDQLHALMGTKAFKELGYKKIIAVGLDYAAGHDETKGFTNAFEAAGGQVETIYMPLGTIDPSPYVTRLVTKQADAVFVNLWGADAPRFIKAAAEYGLTKRMPFIANGTAVDESDTLPGVGESGIGILNYRNYATAISTELNKKFVEAVRKKIGKVPNQYTYTGYMAAKTLIQALNATNGNTDAAVLSAALEKIDVDSPAGRFRYDENHQAILNLFIRRVAAQGGGIENVVVDEVPNVKATP